MTEFGCGSKPRRGIQGQEHSKERFRFRAATGSAVCWGYAHPSPSSSSKISLPPMMGSSRYFSRGRFGRGSLRPTGMYESRMSTSYPKLSRIPRSHRMEPRFPTSEAKLFPSRPSYRSSASLVKQGFTHHFANRHESPFKACAFCRSNRESYAVYSSHWLKDPEGKVVCPILRRYCCKHCGATGDDAHTDSYCPNNLSGKSRNVKSVLTTAMSSTGRRSGSTQK